MTGCSVEGCPNPHKARGWCRKHYMRWRHHGTPEKIKVRPTCSIEGCGEPHFGLGYCSKHYQRVRLYEDPLFVKKHIGDPTANFWRKVDVRGDDECWPWRAGHDGKGYGTFHPGGGPCSPVGAHRWSYEHLVGPIPADHELDHLCHTRDKSCPGGSTCLHRGCVNPRHLEPVAPVENWSRGRAPSARNRDKTHCKYGHEFTPENTYIRPHGGRRACRVCGRRTTAEYLARKRADA